MLKKFIYLILFFILNPLIIEASTTPIAKVGNNYYYTLEEAIRNVNSNDTITLLSDTVLDTTLLIDKVVNLDLNGNDISSKEKVFLVQGGNLNIKGKGIIKENKPNYGVIVVIGSSNSFDVNYSLVNIEKDVTLEGWSGIFISHQNNKSYGVKINFDGKINAVNDIQGKTGIGIYVNGNIQDEQNFPIVNILDNAKIKSTGNGIYIAGISTFNINKSYIYGVESAIAIKSGILNINGATVVTDGEDKTPTIGFNNGIEPSGSAIQIESNNNYAGKIQLNISSGIFESKNSYVIYEYIGRGTNSLIYSMNISGGIFESKSKPVFSFSDSFKSIHSGFISGGKYTSNPDEYLKSGYSTIKQNNFYIINKSTIKKVSGIFIKEKSNFFIDILIIIFLTTILFVSIYFNKKRLKNLFYIIKNRIKKDI